MSSLRAPDRSALRHRYGIVFTWSASLLALLVFGLFITDPAQADPPIIRLDPTCIRYSQGSINCDVSNILEDMCQNGYNKQYPLNVVEISPGQYCSMDNRRLYAAQCLDEMPWVRVHQPCDLAYRNYCRNGTRLTWEEALRCRMGTSGRICPENPVLWPGNVREPILLEPRCRLTTPEPVIRIRPGISPCPDYEAPRLRCRSGGSGLGGAGLRCLSFAGEVSFMSDLCAQGIEDPYERQMFKDRTDPFCWLSKNLGIRDVCEAIAEEQAKQPPPPPEPRTVVVGIGCAAVRVKVDPNRKPLSPEEEKRARRNAACYMGIICLPTWTKIATPDGEVLVTDLKEGMLVYSQDKNGNRISVPIIKYGSTTATGEHHVLKVTLRDGRVVSASPRHPLVDGRLFENLKNSDDFDGSTVASIESVPYNKGTTYDLLPAGETGFYWADGVLIASTLKH